MAATLRQGDFTSPAGWPKMVACLWRDCDKRFLSPGPSERICPKCRAKFETARSGHQLAEMTPDPSGRVTNRPAHQ